MKKLILVVLVLTSASCASSQKMNPQLMCDNGLRALKQRGDYVEFICN